MFRGLAVAAAIVGAIQGVATGKGLSLSTVLPGLIAIVVIFGGTAIWLRTSRVRRTDKGLLQRWRWGVPQRPRTVAGGIYLPEVVNGFGATVARLALFDADGRAVAHLASEFWDHAALDQLARSWGSAVTIVPETLPGKEALLRYPTALAYRERHPRLFPALIVLGFTVFAALIVVVALVAGSQAR